MGRKDGETMAPTVYAPKQSVNAAPITTERTGTSRAGSSTAPSIAPMTANANTEAVIERSNHAAYVGRDRGRESPIPVSPARAALGGREAPCAKACIPVRAVVNPAAAPTIPYWTSRDPLAPAITPTTINSSAAHTGKNHNPRTPAARLHVYVSFSAASRSTSSPAAHR
jgi:hypothetical protein